MCADPRRSSDLPELYEALNLAGRALAGIEEIVEGWIIEVEIEAWRARRTHARGRRRPAASA